MLLFLNMWKKAVFYLKSKPLTSKTCHVSLHLDRSAYQHPGRCNTCKFTARFIWASHFDRTSGLKIGSVRF